ncbi:hypothetical protein [Vulcanisaeta thermophila]|uniref:hypothetical protein n=1 Tax=Vulcanisaeta thermophila TaxID=867917 RepID=UPI00138A28B6|nr:hypothetical protein [Vulcanisaeta thermophila]
MCMGHIFMSHDHTGHGDDKEKEELRREVEMLKLRVEKLEAEVELLRSLVNRGGSHDH